MGIYQVLESDMKNALKAGDSGKLSVLRMVISAIKMAIIENNVKELADTEILQILQKQTKQRKESIVQFEKGNRNDLADKEALELKILESYMPKQLSEEELLSIIKSALAESGAGAKSEAGKAMKIIMPKVAGKADGKTVSRLLAQFLK
jgi:hypothetical protein